MWNAGIFSQQKVMRSSIYEEPQFKSKKAKQQSSTNRKRRPNAELKFDIQINVSITNCNGMAPPGCAGIRTA
jgi:hypothetical protein